MRDHLMGWSGSAEQVAASHPHPVKPAPVKVPAKPSQEVIDFETKLYPPVPRLAPVGDQVERYKELMRTDGWNLRQPPTPGTYHVLHHKWVEVAHFAVGYWFTVEYQLAPNQSMPWRPFDAALQHALDMRHASMRHPYL